MSYVIGVDGGGTRTRAVLLDTDGTELGRADGPGAVVTREYPTAAVQAVTACVAEAAEVAGVALPAAAIWAGLAGAGQDAARTAVLGALLNAGLASVVHIGTDVEAAFQDAFDDGPGILVIAGTGSIAWGRTADGHRVRVGGWGHHLGDEGSGFAIGMAALRHVVRAEDGRIGPTALTTPVLRHCGVGHARGLIGWIESATKGDVAALAPIVIEAAEDGDGSADEIVTEAVEALDAHVEALLDRLGPTPEPPSLALWGGLLAGDGPLRARAIDVLGGRSVTLIEKEIDPPTGAARLARALL